MKTPAALVIASVAALLPALPAAAEEPVDAVKAFYDHPGLELEPTARDRFVDPARRILDQNDAIKAGGEPDGCLDPALPFNDTDYDLAEVTGSLKLAQSVTGAGMARECSSMRSGTLSEGSARCSQSVRSHRRHVTPTGTTAW